MKDAGAGPTSNRVRTIDRFFRLRLVAPVAQVLGQLGHSFVIGGQGGRFEITVGHIISNLVQISLKINLVVRLIQPAHRQPDTNAVLIEGTVAVTARLEPVAKLCKNF